MQATLDRVTKRDCSRASALVSQMKQRELRVMNKLNIADQPAHDKARMEERVAAAASAIKASRAAAGKAAADARAASQDAAASLESAAQASATRAAAAEARAHLGLGDPAEQKDKLSIESAANAADFVTKMKGIQQKHKTIRLEAEEKNRLAKLAIKHKKRTEVEHALSLIVSEVERVALKERGRMRASLCSMRANTSCHFDSKYSIASVTECSMANWHTSRKIVMASSIRIV